MAAQQITHIFWTGGWDSTYRMVELSRKEVTVQPVYCMDPKRGSTRIELERMEKILQMLTQKEETKATFLPIKKIDITLLPPNLQMEKAWKEIANQIHIGTQYIWLAKIAQQYPGIELGLEKPNGEFSGAISTLQKFGKLASCEGVCMLEKAHTTAACYTLFGNMSFPILHLTETDMLNNICRWHYEDIMKQIWFCHVPCGGGACGICRPCQQKMECHMEFLLDKPAQRRYKALRVLSKLTGRRIASKLMRTFLILKEK